MRLRPSDREIIKAVEEHHGDNDAVVGGFHISTTIGGYGGAVRMSDGVVRMRRPSRNKALKTDNQRVYRERWAR